MIPSPSVVGLWICERVIVEAGTGNPSLISIFTGRHFEEFPSPAIPFSVFCCLTDCLGRGIIRLEVVDLQSGALVHREEHAMTVHDRRAIDYVHFRVRNLVFPEQGVYEFGLFADDDPIARRSLRVYRRPSLG